MPACWCLLAPCRGHSIGVGSSGGSAPGFPPLENGFPLLQKGTQRDNTKTYPLVVPATASWGPSTCVPPGRGRCAWAQHPPLRRSLRLPRPSVPGLRPAGAPPARLRRVTRGAQLWQAGAGGGDSRQASGMAAAVVTSAGPLGPEPMPSYTQLVQRSWGSAVAAARGCVDCGWGLARRSLAEHAHLAPSELLLLALGALGWTVLRSAATTRLFRVSTAGDPDMGWGTPGRCAPLSVSASWVTECGGLGL